MKPSTEPSSGDGSPSAAGEDALTRARALVSEIDADFTFDMQQPGEPSVQAAITLIAAALDAAYARGRAAGPVADEATIERVARAIGEADNAIVSTGSIENYRRILARAALAAIPAPPAGKPDPKK